MDGTFVSFAMGVSFLCSLQDVPMRLAQARRSDDLFAKQFSDLFFAVTQLRQHFGGVLAEQRGSGNLGREAGELHRAADRKVSAARLMLHVDYAAAGAQERIVGKLLHGKYRPAWHLELPQHI